MTCIISFLYKIFHASTEKFNKCSLLTWLILRQPTMLTFYRLIKRKNNERLSTEHYKYINQIKMKFCLLLCFFLRVGWGFFYGNRIERRTNYCQRTNIL